MTYLAWRRPEEELRRINKFADEARELLSKVQYLNYEWEVREDYDGEGLLMRARYIDADIYTCKEELQHTAWTAVSVKSGLSRVVSGAMKLALTSAEHRCREAFLYKGRRIFGPHFHIDDLYELCKDREDAGQ